MQYTKWSLYSYCFTGKLEYANNIPQHCQVCKFFVSYMQNIVGE